MCWDLVGIGYSRAQMHLVKDQVHLSYPAQMHLIRDQVQLSYPAKVHLVRDRVHLSYPAQVHLVSDWVQLSYLHFEANYGFLYIITLKSVCLPL